MKSSLLGEISIGFVLFFNVVLLSGCVRSQVKSLGFCRVDLNAGDKILIPYIPSPNFTFTLNLLKSKFKKHNIEAFSMEEEEWNFKSVGIANPLDSQYYTKLVAQGFKYFLMIDVLDKKSPRTFHNYYSPIERSQMNDPQSYTYNPHYNDDMSSIATLKIDLFSLDQNQSVYRFEVKTTISGLSSRDKDGGETIINLSDKEMAINKALIKALRVITRKCKG